MKKKDITSELLKAGRENPLPAKEEHSLITKCVLVLQTRARERGDTKGLKTLKGKPEVIARRILDERRRKSR